MPKLPNMLPMELTIEIVPKPKSSGLLTPLTKAASGKGRGATVCPSVGNQFFDCNPPD